MYSPFLFYLPGQCPQHAGVLYTSYAFECERRVQAKDAEAFAAEAADDSDAAVARLKEAVTIEDSIQLLDKLT